MEILSIFSCVLIKLQSLRSVKLEVTEQVYVFSIEKDISEISSSILNTYLRPFSIKYTYLNTSFESTSIVFWQIINIKTTVNFLMVDLFLVSMPFQVVITYAEYILSITELPAMNFGAIWWKLECIQNLKHKLSSWFIACCDQTYQNNSYLFFKLF